MGLTLIRLLACSLLGLVLSGSLAIGLLFVGGPLDWLPLSGEPLASLALWLLPESFWLELGGVHDPLHNPALHSFLALCAGLGQTGLLLGLGCYQLWYRS